MRRSFRRVGLGVCAVVLTTAAVLGYVARGDAAGTNICPGSVCLTALVSPHVTSAVPESGFAAFAVGKFTNNSPSTATHLALKLSFTAGTADAKVVVGTIGMFVDNAPIAVNCIPADSSVSCSFPNLAGGHVAKLQFPFTPVTPTAGSTVRATFGAAYGESNGGGNDTQNAYDELKISGAGKCTAAGSKLDSVSNLSQRSSIGVLDYPKATEDQQLPCTAVGIDVSETSIIDRNGIEGYPVTLELPLVAGFATVQHDVTPLPAKTTVKSLVILESLDRTGDSFTLMVPPCNPDGLPKIPADTGFSGDTCVFSRSSLPKGGARFIMHALGAKTDPRYTP